MVKSIQQEQNQKHCKLEGSSMEAKGLKFEKNKKYQISAQIQHLKIKAALIDISINIHYIDIKQTCDKIKDH